MRKKAEYSALLQWAFIVTTFLLITINVEAMGRKTKEQLVLPESSNKYGWFKTQRIRFDNGKMFKQAQMAINKGDYEVAEQKFLEALKIDPGSNRAKLGLINVFTKQKKLDKAIDMNTDLLAIYPDFVNGYKYQGVLAGQKNETALAIFSYKTVLYKTKRTDSRHIDALRNLSELYYKIGRCDLAQGYSERLIKGNDSLALRVFLAECAIKQDNFSKALAEFNQALPMAKKDKQKGNIQQARGFILYKQNDFENARIALEDALRLIPDVMERLHIVKQLGDIAYIEKNYKLAESRFKTYLNEEFDESVEAAYIETLIVSEKWDEAQKEAFSYIEKEDLSEDFQNRLLLGLVQIYKHEDNPSMTYKIARQAYEATKKNDLLLEMAYAEQRLGMSQEALEYYKAYLDDNFSIAPAFSYYYLLKKERRYAEAGGVLEKMFIIKNLSPTLLEEVMYEKAQLYRATDRLDEYYKAMDALITHDENYRYIMEYASILFGAGEHDKAVALYQRCLDKNPDKSSSFKICCCIADVYLAKRRPDNSIEWLENALKYGAPDVIWQLVMARIEYNAQDYEACVDRLLTIDSEEKSDFINLHIGFSFYKMELPGLALYYLNKVKEVEALSSKDQRYAFYSNRAYLVYDQGQYNSAKDDVEKALALKDSHEMRVVQLRTLIALSEYEESRDLALELLNTQSEVIRKKIFKIINNSEDSDLKDSLLVICNSNTSFILPKSISAIRGDGENSELKVRMMAFLSERKVNKMSELLDHIGKCELNIGNYDEAIEYLSGAIELVPSLYTTYYLRGIAYHKIEDNEDAEKDYLVYRDSTDIISRNFWGDLAIVEGALKNYDKGINALNKAIEIYPYDINTLEEAGYQYMKAVSNKNSKASFAAAIDIYNDIIPLLEGSNSIEYVNNNSAIKREYSKLDKVFGGGIYFSKTDYNLSVPASVASIGGALPSQAGVGVSYRPPIFGFRNERTSELFARIYGNFKDDSWTMDRNSYQVGFGAQYKPFRKLNAIISAEKLTKFGKNSEDNFLLRVLDSIDWGQKPTGDRKWQLAGRLYGDLGYFLQDHRRWYYYLDGREGVSWYIDDKFLLTVPQVIGIVRHETDDDSCYLSYNMIGVGINGRLLEKEKVYTIERGYVDLYLHYVWGWFWETPVDLDDKSFEGFVFGASFVK